jgi:hypothetical protein
VRRFLVEMYAPGTSELSELAASAEAAAGDGVSYMRTIFVPEDEVCFHVFEGPSMEALARLFTGARIVEAVEERRGAGL